MPDDGTISREEKLFIVRYYQDASQAVQKLVTLKEKGFTDDNNHPPDRGLGKSDVPIFIRAVFEY